MPDVYVAGEFVPEIKGATNGAVSVVCQVPKDLELVYALAEIAPRPPSSPLSSLAQTLRAKSLDWHEWWQYWTSIGGRIDPLPARPVSTTSEPSSYLSSIIDESVEIKDSEIETLKQVISVLYHMWIADPDQAPDLVCCISIPLNTESSSPGIEWESKQPALTFGQGSLWVRVGLAALKSRGFLAGLILRGGIDAASRRAGLVNKAREVAIAKVRSSRGQEAEAAKLPDLRFLKARDIPANHELCILIHGLCSTDVGTFDLFEEEIRKRSLKSNTKLYLVGFPHDSLTASIEDNAKDLAQLLVALKKRNIRLVCHSRGGLVARRTAVWLRQEDNRLRKGEKKEPWIHSCVTFGTPHLGTSAANAPKDLTASLLALAHLKRSPSVSAVADVLALVQSGSTWTGVSELVPSGTEGSCLPALIKQEGDVLYLDDLPLNFLFLGSIGPNEFTRRNWKVRIVERIVGTSKHDLLVPIESSVPRLRNPECGLELTDRTHFEYFSLIDHEQGPPSFWDEAIATLGLNEDVRSPNRTVSK